MRTSPAAIGRYQVRDRLGQGGMGTLYLALDPAIDRLLALKVLRADSEELRERFLREARLAARLQHPNIVTIYDVGSHEGQPFIAMEYIAGETLGELIRRRAPLPLARKLAMVRDACQGLSYAHQHGIVHRDIKPANLMVARDTGMLKVLDFGIARGAESTLTQVGMVMGTPNYMSPEQIEGRPVDRRSDVFALGLVMYELVTYCPAFKAETPPAVMHQVLHGTLRPLREIDPSVDLAVPGIIDRAVQKRPAERYQDLIVLRTDLTRVIQRLEAGDNEPTLVAGAPRAEPPAQVRVQLEQTDRARLAERRAAQIAAHLAEGDAVLGRGDVDAALAAAESAALLDAEDGRVVQLLARVRAATEARQVANWVQKARDLLAAGALTEADQAVGEALQRDQRHADALALRLEIDRASEARDRERERAQAVRRALAPLEAHLEAGALEAALRATGEALGYDPSSGEALAARQRVQAAVEARVDQVIAASRADVAAGRLTEAAARLDELTLQHERIDHERASVWNAIAAEAKQRRVEDAARKRREEEARRRAEAEARQKEAEEAKRRADEAARQRAAEAAKRKRAAEEARRRAEAEARRKEADEAKRRAEEAARQRAAEEAQRKRAAEEARRRAEAEARRKEADEAKRRAEEAARQRAEAEAREAEAARVAAEAEALRRREAEEAKQRAEEEARRRAEEKARKRAEADAARRERDEARQLAKREAKRRADEAARQRAEEKARRQRERHEGADRSPVWVRLPQTASTTDRRTLYAGGGIAVLLLLLVASLWMWSSPRPQPAIEPDDKKVEQTTQASSPNAPVTSAQTDADPPAPPAVTSSDENATEAPAVTPGSEAEKTTESSPTSASDAAAEAALDTRVRGIVGAAVKQSQQGDRSAAIDTLAEAFAALGPHPRLQTGVKNLIAGAREGVGRARVAAREADAPTRALDEYERAETARKQAVALSQRPPGADGQPSLEALSGLWGAEELYADAEAAGKRAAAAEATEAASPSETTPTPPAKERDATSEPETPVTPKPEPPISNEEAIQQTLKQWAAAYASLNVSRFANLWALSQSEARRLQNAFDQQSRHVVSLGRCAIQEQNQKATATCTVRREIDFKRRDSQQISATVTLQLEKRAARWTITAMR